ncbi:4-azaleucine resistance transporter AzlC [Saccharothrix coeruleofusca]|uniref:AzlC family ABC transporter permease n=1 Tax=Saccharothrix coeruleofusca TaxID=33919 RepID=UPI001AE29B26|nr:AzlC family ABC transporter permease [Saccharothrix coeruleofusca]MBP2337104.1 4-azaleucine resistance transporter AzlC [Saccharothrix coeruleofusca]
MRSIWRTHDTDLLRDVAAIAAAAAVNGASFGAISVAGGLQWWVPLVMSVLVFAGGSQFMAVGVVAAGGSPAAAVLAGLVLNARHLPFGLAVGHVLGRGLAARLVGSHLMVDESVAFSLAQRDPARARTAFWACGATLFLGWNLGVVAGSLVGQGIGDPGAFGLDAAFPAALLALVLPALKDTATLRAALLGAVVALATTPLLPAGVPVLLALVGLVATAGRKKTGRKKEVAA